MDLKKLGVLHKEAQIELIKVQSQIEFYEKRIAQEQEKLDKEKERRAILIERLSDINKWAQESKKNA